jgi:PHP family Zn ribbon phosphoesterase
LTVGVLHRVEALADRVEPVYPEGAPGFFSLIPLNEMLAEILGVGPASREVTRRYAEAINRFGTELGLLLDLEPEEISEYSPLLGEAVRRVRSGKVTRKAGYDGEYGVIRVFGEGELDRLSKGVEFSGDPLHTKGKRGKNKSSGPGFSQG